MKRHIIVATTAAAALIAGGTVSAMAVGGGSSAPGTAAGAQQTAANDSGRSSIHVQDKDDHDQEDAREARAAKVTASQAAAAALKAVPGTVTGLDLDEDRPGLVWEADVLGKDGKWHEVTLDAGNARVLNQHVDAEDGDDSDDIAVVRDGLKGAKTDAAAAARATNGHGTVTSVELDDDNGTKAAWEVETTTKDGKEHKFLVDPQSGKVTAAPAHDQDDHDGDDDSDDNDGQDD
ncbi:PepSY domain-containing protein [Streptomyces sp. NPDC048248]|uniref:PepSY domain-containing protein n=1 Tax=Streptomyces sp. NPDC048248 TaxID=3365523 RepID=UPI0037134A5B